MKISELETFDPAKYLKSEEAIRLFIEDFRAENDPQLLAEAEEVAARARALNSLREKGVAE